MAGSLIYGEPSTTSPTSIPENLIQARQTAEPLDPAQFAVAGKSSGQEWLRSTQVSGGFKVAHSPGGKSTIKSLIGWGDAHVEEESTAYAPKYS